MISSGPGRPARRSAGVTIPRLASLRDEAQVNDEAASVLLAEDQPKVRAVTAALLRSFGYQVFEAAGGAEALRILAEIGSIDILVTDVIMPGMSGIELAQKIHVDDAAVPLLFISGHAEGMTSEDLKAAHVGFLQKPYRARVLADEVGRLLRVGESMRGRAPNSSS